MNNGRSILKWSITVYISETDHTQLPTQHSLLCAIQLASIKHIHPIGPIHTTWYMATDNRNTDI